jgi:tetratricopeptide (TPR) repeat protein
MYMLRALLPLISLLSAPALAGSDDCLACCTQGGLKACPTRLRVFTEGSYATLDEDGWRVHGMWWMDCDTGARFDAQSTLVVAQPPEAGQVLGPDWPDEALACFQKRCSLPDNTCLRQDAEHWSLVRCRDGQPVGAVEIQSLLRPPGQPEDRIAVPQGGANWSGVVLDMPPPPVGVCTAPKPLVDEGARRARAAAEAEARGSLQTAVNTYQAAIAVDPCNTAAWGGLGSLALRAGRLPEAADALEVATRLQPGNYGAWTQLGQAYEGLGWRTQASLAYGEALEINPEHMPARLGQSRSGLQP